MHPRLIALFSDFDQAGLRWALMRLPVGSGRKAGDVDVLVDHKQMARVCQIVKQQGFTRLPAWKPDFHFLSYEVSTDQWIWLHLVIEISFGRNGLLTTNAGGLCLDRRQRLGLVSILADDDAFWELLLHCLLDKGQITARHRTRLLELGQKRSLSGPLAQVIETVLPVGWNLEQITSRVREEHWSDVEGLVPALTDAWKAKDHVGSWQALKSRLLRMMNHLKNFPHSRGLNVALIGPDGAGKSTLIAAIGDSFMLPVRTVYMGLTGGYLPYINRLLLPFLVVPGRLVVFWARYMLALYHQARGKLVVFDRYTYDYMVPTPKKLSWWGHLYRWIDGHSIPSPDLLLILDAPGEVMFERKGEYEPGMLEDWRSHFLSIPTRIHQGQVVDTNRPMDVVRADVIHRIWQQYELRWKDE